MTVSARITFPSMPCLTIGRGSGITGMLSLHVTSQRGNSLWAVISTRVLAPPSGRVAAGDLLLRFPPIVIVLELVLVLDLCCCRGGREFRVSRLQQVKRLY